MVVLKKEREIHVSNEEICKLLFSVPRCIKSGFYMFGEIKIN